MVRVQKDFLKQGYAVVGADDLKALVDLRRRIFEHARKLCAKTGDDPEDFFNHFHRYEVAGGTLEESRLKLAERCSGDIDAGARIFTAFRDAVAALLGPDVLVHREVDLAVQRPHDPGPFPAVRDVPARLPAEIAVWTPLVDCYGTKSLYILDQRKTKEALGFLDDGENRKERYASFCARHGQHLNVPFGSALVFWTGLIRGSRVNTEPTTMWSVAARYNSFFSPVEIGSPSSSFNILALSPAAKFGLQFQSVGVKSTSSP